MTVKTKIPVLVLGACLASATAYAQVCRVTVSGTASGDGSNWNTEAMDPHTALGDTNCSEIWVAGGVYKPGAAGDRFASFTIAREVEVYGGFDGIETKLGERDPAANPTVLSGDIDNNDTVNADGVTETTDGIVGDNSFHVVFMDGQTVSGPITTTTVLDGFIITGGLANQGSNETYLGGGLFCAGDGSGNGCSPALGNLVFSGNRALQDGGAMFNSGYGDGISNPVLNNVVFSGNSAGLSGGAMYNDGRHGGVSSPVLNHVRFSGNNAFGTGGAMLNGGGNGGTSSPALNHVVFNGNGGTGPGDVMRGGAMYNDGPGGVSSPVLNNVTFSGNSSTLNGGAMVNHGSAGVSSPVLSNVTFSGNSAPSGSGGAMHNFANNGVISPVLNNVTFSGNSASQGGAMMNQDVSISGTSNPVLNNVLLWGNDAGTGPEIYNSNATPEINDSIVQGGCPDDSICNNIIDTDPLLAPLADNGGFTQTFLPDADGAAVDAGNDATCTDEDQRGVSRPQGDHCDIGAVELRHRVLEFDPAELDFGSVAAGATSEALIAMLENSGDIDLTGLAINVPAGFDADTGDCGTVLPVGSSCQLSVTFAPTTTGAVADALVADSAEGAGAQLQLAGIGVEPGALDTDPDLLHFEEVVITRTRTLSFNVLNTAAPGGTGVELASVSVTSGGPAFAIAGIGCADGSVLDPGESCVVDISFTPQQVVLHEGMVQITDDNGQQVSLSLSGTVLPDGIMADRFRSTVEPPSIIR